MKLEDRIRATLHAEAERFEPQLAATQLKPATRIRPWMAFAGAAAALVVIVGTGVLLSRSQPPADTLPPPGSSQPQTSTTAQVSPPTVPGALVPWVPEYSVDGGSASVVLEYIEGSSVEISWPEDLDLMSEGVVPYGYASLGEAASRDFFIRRGNVEEVVNQFGAATVLESYSDMRGGTVNLWRPEGAGVDYLGFQFDDWAVLVYEGGTQVGTPPMSIRNRQLWVEGFRGESTPNGFLRLYGDEPLRIGAAGANLSMTLRSPEGSVELHLTQCEASEPSGPFNEFVSWCDESGWVDVHVTGSEDFARSVYEGLDIGAVFVAGVSGPDSDGSYAHLQDEVAAADERWGETLEMMGPNPAYRMRLSGNLGLIAIDASSEVRDGSATVAGTWVTSDAPMVETLFQLIENAIARGEEVSVLFHGDGYPIRITWDSRGIDDEMWLDVELEWIE